MAGNGETDFNSLSDEAWREQEVRDNQLLSQALSTDTYMNNPLNAILDEFQQEGKIDQRGKADDAIDYEDIDLSDEDLGDEDEDGRAGGQGAHDDQDDNNLSGAPLDLPGLTDDGGTSNNTDDLFGDAPVSSPIDGLHAELASSPHPLDADGDERMQLSALGGDSLEDLRLLNFDHGPDISASNQDPNIPPPAENFLDTVKQAWPAFRENAVLNFSELFPQKQAAWLPKKPPKPPKPLIPTKLGLELDADQEKLFRVPGPASNSVWQKIKDADAKGLVCLEEPEPLERADLEVFNMDDEVEFESVGGYTLRDIAMICDDWDSMIRLGDVGDVGDVEEVAAAVRSEPAPVKDEDEDALWDSMFLDEPPTKRRKVVPTGLPEIPRFTAPNFDNFLEATAKLGKRVILDLNDPYLLVDDVESERAAKRRKIQQKMVRMANGKMGRELTQRFNFSNDVAYEALKENHSGRIRATLLTIPVDHSLPAQRLAWPYYRVKLSASDPHSYHRPQLHIRKEAHTIVKFAKPSFQKRKDLKGKRIADVYKESKDMSMNDNSTSVLWEYCEEIPTVLSNFGMGQRIINYYRRSKAQEGRPEKGGLGEACILLPEDRSPFSIFGHVAPGEVVPTLHNSMFRAPIYKHTPKSTDFLVGRSHTGQDGDQWYVRNIDHIYVVGQTLPLMDVPGPHSRKVTNIAKNRLKMVSYRLMRKSDHVTLHDITRHVAESNESQNRQKLKEFLVFRKDSKDWALPEGEEMMDERGIRCLVKPEEVCLLDAMQVGAHELENSGYEALPEKDDEKENGVVDPSEPLPPDALARKMTPWIMTRNFIDACHGKAMLTVHGAGDPTGRGLGISFLKTSMKGGFLEQLQGPLATSADAIERQRKANNGHMYNVKNQDSLYAKSLSDIWQRQRESLTDVQEHDDEDVLAQEDEDDRFNVQSQVVATPIQGEAMSQVSRSAASGISRRKLKIIRQVRKENGEIEMSTEIVHDPIVIHQYSRKRRQREVEEIDIYNVSLTGDQEKDRLIYELADKEHERLQKNKERRKKREKQKKLLQKTRGVGSGIGLPGGGLGGGGDDGTDEASPEPSSERASGTTRKCANCGQVGHIKTNKKCVNCKKQLRFIL